MDARSAAAMDVARKVRGWNVAREPGFRDLASRAIDDARESFRDGPEGLLPAPGADARFDALLALARQVDASPQGVLAALSDLERAVRQDTSPIRPGGA